MLAYNLYNERQLIAVLDLDDTLVKTIPRGREPRTESLETFDIDLPDGPHVVIVRPGWPALRKLLTRFQVYICTHGEKSYAQNVW